MVGLSGIVACHRTDLAAVLAPGAVEDLSPRLGRAGDGATAGPAASLDVAGAVAALDAPPFALPDPPERGIGEALRAFYAGRAAQPAWLGEGRPRIEAHQLVGLLGRLDAQGLDPADYRTAALAAALAEARAGRGEPGSAERLEVGLTWAALLALSHLHHGRALPDELGERWPMRRGEVDLAATLEAALRSERALEQGFLGVAPEHPQLAALLEALSRYRGIAAEGGWPEVPAGPTLGEGDAADPARLRALAARLHAEGFLAEVPPELRTATAAGAPAPVYSRTLAEAVAAFQRTRTLDDDGRLGPGTLAELNVPAAERVRQIELNVERWRWVPDDLDGTAVVVNIPGYTLDVMQDRRVVESMPVVVGQKGWQTPVMADRIDYLVVNPYWNVPPRILAEEVLPKIQSDPSYLAANEMEIVRGESDDAELVHDTLALASERGVRVRQRPGSRNPLGRVKFMFPNRHNVYLHDTPARAPFARADRSASHGCIRVERPVELAERLLGPASGRLHAALASGETASVALPERPPVMLLYFTVGVRPGGQVEFYEDIYGLDAAHDRVRG